MNPDDIFKKAQSFRSAIAIDHVPHFVRVSAISFCLTAALFLSCALVLTNASVVNLLSLEKLSGVFETFSAYGHLFIPLLCLMTSFGLLGIGINAYHAYYHLRGVRRVFGKNDVDITYEVAEVFSVPHPTLSSLMMHRGSAFVVNRLGLDKEDMIARFGSVALPSVSESRITFGSLWRSTYESYPELGTYLLSQSIKKETLYRVSVWVDRMIEDRKKSSAWWWRENLSKVRGFAKILSYGMTGYMSNYAKEVALDPKLSELGDVILHQAECDQLEEVLSKRQGANAVVIGPDGSGRHTLVLALARAIERGEAYAEIEQKRMFLLEASSFELIHEKLVLENTLIAIFNEAVVARNIIFVIDDIAKLVGVCKQLEVDFFSLIDPYIAHDAVSLVVLTDETTASQDEFRRVFESRFESIRMKDLDNELFLPYLEDRALAVEKATGKYVTYPALEAVASALPALFAEDAPLVKANALLESIAGQVSLHAIIKESDVENYLETATGVAQGAVTGDEKDQLLHLEETLSQHVMGQKEAVLSVAKTMRRVRSGITDKGKPMGTFLFLGPTGSGKTETAKTLAHVFFGSEEYMSRIDMGEYALDESAKRLLGDKDNEGDLARLVHARPHGVLLLDEFEKSSKDVKDLFLRALDEGVFTNGQGKIVSLRTQIIIATSNAGSELIRESSLSAQYDEAAFSSVKQTVLNAILEQGIFKPELVNRFDAAVMFLPLSDEALRGVAKKMLDELGDRMHEKGYNITWSEDLVGYVVEQADAAEFGGRALQRVVQDIVEDALSKKIIEGSLKAGDKIAFSKADLSSI